MYVNVVSCIFLYFILAHGESEEKSCEKVSIFYCVLFHLDFVLDTKYIICVYYLRSAQSDTERNSSNGSPRVPFVLRMVLAFVLKYT